MPKLHLQKNTLKLRSPLIHTAIKTLITSAPLLLSLTAMEKAHATVTIPSTSGQVVLQSPTYAGDNTFIAPPSTSIDFGVTGDNSKDWNLTNQGTITTYATDSTVILGSATGDTVFTNSGRVEYWGNAGGGVRFNNGGTLNNTASGVITTDNLYGVVGSGAPVTINNDGLINGSSSGMRITGGVVTQSATGTITSNNGIGVLNDGGQISITNNSGSITGLMGVFLRADSGGTIVNSGTITGTSGSGINIASTGTGTITNNGTITGTGAAGINLAGTSDWTITNSGTITGAGTAINIANTANNIHLILQTASVLNGNVTSAGANTSLELQGSGTANNAFSGFSRISVQQSGTAWTLGGIVSTTGSNALVDIQNGQLNVTGTLNNAGGFNISNNGALQVTGTMTNAGISNIANNGILLIGTGGTTGSITGNVVNDGTMIFNRSNDMVLNGVISGSGSVQKLGVGTLAIDGANTYSGLTTIQGGGGIQLNNTQGVGTGGIVLSSAADTLTFATSNSQTASGLFSNAVSGAGTIHLSSQENIVLGGNSTNFSGVFNIGSTATLTATSAENLGTASIVNNGIFQADATTNWALSNTLTGTGAFIKTGIGDLLINQIDHSGPTTITEGTLLVGAGSSSARLGSVGSSGLVTVASGATLSGTGTVMGTVLNQGTITALNTVNGYTQNPASNLTLNGSLDNSGGSINLAGGQVGNTLTVMGDYTGGGTLNINTKLGNDASVTDQLIIKGNSNGITRVTIQNKGGSGSQTTTGIKMVEVDGTSNGSFDLSNRVTIGMYDYTLNKAGDGSWYLQSLKNTQPQSESLIPETGVTLGNQAAAQAMFTHSMYDRMGDLRNGVATVGNGGWVRVSGGRTEFNAGNSLLSQKIDMTRLQFGSDIATIPTTNGNWQAGLMGSYAHARTDSNSSSNNYTSTYNATDASGKVNGYTIGAYATWLQKNNTGLYIDSWLQLGRFRNSINGSNQSDYNSTGISASVETGYRFKLGAIGNMTWSAEPQAQLVVSKLDSNDFTTANGMSASDASGTGTLGRLGIRLSGQDTNTGLSPFAELNAWFGKYGADSVKFSDASGERVVSNDIPNTRIQLKAGLQGNLDKNWQVWGDVGTEIGSNDFTSYQGSLGVRYNW